MGGVGIAKSVVEDFFIFHKCLCLWDLGGKQETN
jgi:hypothetical protein